MLRPIRITASTTYKRGVGTESARNWEAIPRAGDGFLLLDKLEFGVLALETEGGAVYVQPSGWERLYLLWTFRHFHSLPLKTLNSRQRKLVQRLPRCTAQIVRVPGRTKLIGTVEGAAVPGFIQTAKDASNAEVRFANTTAKKVRRKTKLRTASTTAVNFRIAYGAIGLVILALGSLLATRGMARWKYFLAKAPAIANSEQNWAPSSQNNPAKMDNEPASTTTAAQLVSPESSLAPAPVLPSVAVTPKAIEPLETIERAADSKILESKSINRTPEKLRDTPAGNDVLSANLQQDNLPETTQRILFSGPPRKMVYPIAPMAAPRGKVTMLAVIGEDGKVREIRTLSGSKILSAAAASAIRQWRYTPILKDGEPVEAQTNVSFLFISEDVVSISFPTVLN